MDKTNNFAIVIMVCFCLSGCMSGILRVDTIHLSPLPPPSPVKIPNENPIRINVHVEDRRTNAGGWLGGKLDHLRVGHAENAFGESIAPDIAVDTPLETSFTKAMEDQLAAKGFSVQKDSPLLLDIRIENFFAKFNRQFGSYVALAELHMKVELIEQTAGAIYTQDVFSKGKSGTSFWQEGKTAELALNQALELGLATVFENPDFISALNHQGK